MAGPAGGDSSGEGAAQESMQTAGLVLSISSEPERGRDEGGSELADGEEGRDAIGGWDWDIGGDGWMSGETPEAPPWAIDHTTPSRQAIEPGGDVSIG